jgi:hypothetical protein
MQALFYSFFAEPDELAGVSFGGATSSVGAAGDRWSIPVFPAARERS